jgi:hypothetical protein
LLCAGLRCDLPPVPMQRPKRSDGDPPAPLKRAEEPKVVPPAPVQRPAGSSHVAPAAMQRPMRSALVSPASLQRPMRPALVSPAPVQRPAGPSVVSPASLHVSPALSYVAMAPLVVPIPADVPVRKPFGVDDARVRHIETPPQACNACQHAAKSPVGGRTRLRALVNISLVLRSGRRASVSSR